MGLSFSTRLPDLVHQEIWAWLLVHHAISALITRAAEAVDLDPDRISFARVLCLVRRNATGTAAFPPEDWDHALPHVIAEITSKTNPSGATAATPAWSNEPATTTTASRNPARLAPATPAHPPSRSARFNPSCVINLS